MESAEVEGMPSLRKHPFLLALRRWGRFAKRPRWQRARRNGCFRRLRDVSLQTNVFLYCDQATGFEKIIYSSLSSWKAILHFAFPGPLPAHLS